MDEQRLEYESGTVMPDGMSAAALAKLPLALVLTNPNLDGNPIIYANRAFEQITGYAAAVTIGRNCRFLQGEETDPEQVRQIGEALRKREDVSVEILNYRADGSKFMNHLTITPLFDQAGELQCFLGVQRDVSANDGSRAGRAGDGGTPADLALGEIQHRVKNHLSMIVGMIRMQARMKTSEESFSALARRIESLQLLYQEMGEAGFTSSRSERVPLGAYVSRVAATIGHLDGRHSVRINVDCDAIEVKVDRAARIGLLFSELLTNALKHAFVGRDEGVVEARLKMLSSGVIRLTVTDDGVGMPDGVDWPYGKAQGSSVPEPLDEDDAREVEADFVAARNAVEEDDRKTARQIASSMGLETPAGGEPAAGDGAEAAVAKRRPQRSGGLGGRITISLVRGLDARLDVTSHTVGTTVTVDIPPEDKA